MYLFGYKISLYFKVCFKLLGISVDLFLLFFLIPTYCNWRYFSFYSSDYSAYYLSKHETTFLFHFYFFLNNS